MTDDLLEIHAAVHALMRESGPRRLSKYLAVLGEDISPEADLTEQRLAARLGSAEAGDPLLEMWRKLLKHWDHEEEAPWAAATAPNTVERRSAVYALLGISEQLQETVTQAVPVAVAAGPVVISKERPDNDWYEQSRPARSFYWPAYEKYLLTQRKWSADAVASLDQATTQVVSRLADPTSPLPYQAKGLVVGYVQSGKTANFTGVAAKAFDAGYRLVIVLGGTLNLLRRQTQRRLDMELVGRENVLGGIDPADPVAMEGVDYQDDKDWAAGRFLKHGAQPALLGHFNIERLTTRDDDYRSLLRGITALEFDKREPELPLYDPRNLHRTAGRLMVVKKNKTVLTKLVRDLKKIRTSLAEIPVLIIDDESDQASVNTSDPRKWQDGETERTAINGLLSSLIKMLPRAQYVGYTATPFANVFIDPSDVDDIFPNDFLISLPRPSGYMGAQDFHDLGSDISPEHRTIANSQEKAHVRSIEAPDGESVSPEEATEHADSRYLREALDMYVLAGAMKLYREDQGADPYRHHTMLVHESVKQTEHRDLAERLQRLWDTSDYFGPRGHARLRALFSSDVQPVSALRSEGFAVPFSFDGLAPYVGPAVIRIGGNNHPILIVNGDKDIEQPELDFDSQSVWKILVGGTKLSRGFTVEGLTVTYYRRSTAAADTLMQMGRWFGFRHGYRDLVRLYIGRNETRGRQTVDLYEGFEGICRDEESFRSQLALYNAAGGPPLTPAQVPPLVAQHISWIKPSAPNKMFNAELVEIRSPGRWVEPAAHPAAAADTRHNTDCWNPVYAALGGGERLTFVHLGQNDRGSYTRFAAQTGVVSHDVLLKILAGLRWDRPELFAPHLSYLADPSEAGAAADDWVVIAPQLSTAGAASTDLHGSGPLTVVNRARSASGVFSRISGMAHRQPAERIAGLLPATGEDPFASQLAKARRGAVLLYPVVDQHSASRNGSPEPGPVTTAFALLPPGSTDGTEHGPLIRFRTIDSGTDSPVVTRMPD
ncbi:Z1 domain-containing protein [Streptomyces sp. CB01881]|uniref:Z1 domain-containing protein n=1 Tax=Streptomyces sp. CB01881 TaxID=2078691 RepID=UPI000CDCB058|nr:Z1 domain-containing protein [Streptomyces sp. CB01881]AUY50499.1 endonuclease [Streptomyces sp. CB01881]TYC73886.1 endonuclease [Streptomyces sp. CB01881]